MAGNQKERTSKYHPRQTVKSNSPPTRIRNSTNGRESKRERTNKYTIRDKQLKNSLAMRIRNRTNGRESKRERSNKYHPRQTVIVTHSLWESETAPMAGNQKERTNKYHPRQTVKSNSPPTRIRNSTNGRESKRERTNEYHPRQTVKVTHRLWESKTAPTAGDQKEGEQINEYTIWDKLLI